MANSRIPLIVLDDVGNRVASRTPGPLGINDAADPNCRSARGDTPGPLGINDHATPRKVTSAGEYYIIPQPISPSPPLISDQDIAVAAIKHGIEPAVIYAVAKVESGGRTGFDSKARPKILFEARWFHKFTYGEYDLSHPHLSQPTWQEARAYYDEDQWTRLSDAFLLDRKAAQIGFLGEVSGNGF